MEFVMFFFICFGLASYFYFVLPPIDNVVKGIYSKCCNADIKCNISGLRNVHGVRKGWFCAKCKKEILNPFGKALPPKPIKRLKHENT